MRDTARGRKENDAAYVKINTPSALDGGYRNRRSYGRLSPVICMIDHKKKIAKGEYVGIIIFTLQMPGEAHAKTAVRRCQAPEPARTGDPQPTPSGGDRRRVYRQRVLRSPRPGSGQVRDA